VQVEIGNRRQKGQLYDEHSAEHHEDEDEGAQR